MGCTISWLQSCNQQLDEHTKFSVWLRQQELLRKDGLPLFQQCNIGKQLIIAKDVKMYRISVPAANRMTTDIYATPEYFQGDDMIDRGAVGGSL